VPQDIRCRPPLEPRGDKQKHRKNIFHAPVAPIRAKDNTGPPPGPVWPGMRFFFLKEDSPAKPARGGEIWGNKKAPAWPKDEKTQSGALVFFFLKVVFSFTFSSLAPPPARKSWSVLDGLCFIIFWVVGGGGGGGFIFYFVWWVFFFFFFYFSSSFCPSYFPSFLSHPLFFFLLFSFPFFIFLHLINVFFLFLM